MHGFADFGEAPGQGEFADERVRPEPLEEFVFGDHAVAMLNQVDEHLKPFGRDRNHLARAVQFIAFLIERTIAEAIDPRGGSI